MLNALVGKDKMQLISIKRSVDVQLFQGTT